MKADDFYFELPQRLIAQYPEKQRGQSRLMTIDRVTGTRSCRTVNELPEILNGNNFLGPSGKKPLIVFNDTKVRKARLTGKNEITGKNAEFLLVEKVNSKERGCIWKAMVKHLKRKKKGSVYIFFDSEGEQAAKAVVSGYEGEFILLEFDREADDAWLEKYGHIPLPPYIKRNDTPIDAQRYQTIYAGLTGSAAAPTAGLHFTREILDRITAYGINSVFITLHVGLGTFLPVRTLNIEDHKMHEEKFLITDENASLIEKAKLEGRKIIAVGTTSLRTLESAFDGDKVKRGWQSTSIFIYPPYKFKAVDVLFTNFHTPLSTLLMLVSAFADGAFSGRELILESYAEAVREGYRFFSYGDAMLIY